MELTIHAPEEILLSADDGLPPPEGVSITMRLLESVDLSGIGEFVLLIAGGVPASLFAAWLYDKLEKHGAKTIRIDRHEIVVDRGEIERIIWEKIEIRN